MRQEVYDVDFKHAAGGSAGDGDPRGCRDLLNKLLSVTGTFSATYSIQGKIEGGDWHDIATGLTAPSVTPSAASGGFEYAYTAIRIKTTAWTSGNPVAKLSGYNSRTE